MPKKSLICRLMMLALILAPLAPAVATAQERAKAEEAKAFVARAIALYDEQGAEAAYAAIQDAQGGLVDHDLYVFVYGPDRTIVAHGSNPALVGSDVDSYVDDDGLHFGTKFMDEATGEGIWLDYKWHDPVSDQTLPKSSWLVRHDGHVFGAGIYKP